MSQEILEEDQSCEALKTKLLLRKLPLWFLLDAVINFFVLGCSTDLLALLIRCWVSVVRHSPYVQLPF